MPRLSAPLAARSIVPRLALQIVLGAAVGVAALLVARTAHPGIFIDFVYDLPPQPKILRGFFQSERAGALSYAWTGATADLHLPELDRQRRWDIVVRWARPDRDAFPAVISVDGIRVATATLSHTASEVGIALSPRSRAGAQVAFEFPEAAVAGPEDRRVIGAQVDSIRLTPSSSSLGGVLRIDLVPGSAVVGAAFGGLAVVAGVATLEGVLLSAFAAALWAVLAGTGFASITPLAHGTVALLPLILLMAAGLCGPWVRHDWWRRTVAITACVTFVKLTLLLHPEMVVSDGGFHMNRLTLVRNGTYFFTSSGPGGDFPYPVSFYVLASFFVGGPRDAVDTMRLLLLTVDTAAALLVHVAVQRWWSAPAATLATVFYLFCPAGFHVQAIAYLTNGFAQAMAAIGLMAAVLIPLGASRIPAALTAALVLLLALTGHTGTFLILSATLVLLTAAFWWLLAGCTRHLVVSTALIAALSIGAAVGLYYSRFGNVYRAQLSGRVTRVEPSRVAVPVQRAEAHQTQWAPGWTPLWHRLAAVPGYVSKYLGLALVMCAAIGGWRLLTERRRDPLTILLLAWVTGSGLFFVAGLLTPIDVRYYLAVFPALAMLSGYAIQSLWTGGRAGQAISAMLLAWCVVAGVQYWFAWFSPILPR